MMPTSIDSEFATTAGAIAIGNLQEQIDGQTRRAANGQLTTQGTADLIEWITLRGHILGRIVDYEQAGAMAEQLVQHTSANGNALLVRARTRATFHRFTEALDDLDDAESLGADRARVVAERGSIFQAIGRYDEALAIYRDAVERRADFDSLGDLANLHAERGEIREAERAFSESRSCYRGVSPIPVAQLDVQRAGMWVSQGDLWRARSWLEDAVRRLPEYARAQGHLAEVEAALGDSDRAIARLLPLTTSSDDPDHAARLARILQDVGRVEEARTWCGRAASRYDELVTHHLEAFADHAAGFWLDAGADADRALWLATRNYEARPTRRAHELLARATLAHRRAADTDLPAPPRHTVAIGGKKNAGINS